MGIVDKATKVAAGAGAAATAFGLLFRVEGKPVREKDKPASVKLAGVVPLFERDPDGKQYLFGIFRIRDVRRP